MTGLEVSKTGNSQQDQPHICGIVELATDLATKTASHELATPDSLGLDSPGHTPELISMGGALAGADILSRNKSGGPRPSLVPGQHASICAGKRCFDLVLASLALIAALPLLVACALAIRLESEGPVFFWQKRAGRNGQHFSLAKFRTMVVNAEAAITDYLKAHPEARMEWQETQKLRNDPRITRVGKFIRKFSIDELPQLWNVITGEMSLVGPRPIPLYEIPLYGDHYRAYCLVRPGLTGLWQVSGRSNTTYARRVWIDNNYIRDWSPMLDLEIILRTVPAVFKAAGAY